MMYQNAIVTFMDILGFKQLVEADDTGVSISQILDEMERQGTYDYEKGEEVGVRTLTVSDCVIRAAWTPNGDMIPFSTAAMELLRLGLMQLNLLNKDIVIRGGVAHGRVFLEDNRIFGRAYQDAYAIESKKACHPRIVVDSQLVSSVVDDATVPEAVDEKWVAQELRHLVRKDDDGCYFIDYLSIHSDNYDDELDVIEFLQRHKLLIEKRLSQFRGNSAESKYWWMRRYHNDYVTSINDTWMRKISESKQDLVVTVD